MNKEDLNKRFADLTVLEFQELLDFMEDSANTKTCPPPEEIDLANTMGQLTAGQFITVFTHSLPRGLPKP